jgi:hypothetical protein
MSGIDSSAAEGLTERTKVQYRSPTASSRFKVLAVRRLPRRKRHGLRHEKRRIRRHRGWRRRWGRSAGSWLAMMAAAFVGPFGLVVVQRKFLNLETAATR